MEVFVGADYKGFAKKQFILDFLSGEQYTATDEGSFEYREGDDFNDPAIAVAKAVKSTPGSVGILICDSAHGVTMQANRFRGIRAANCSTTESAKLAREHDDANVLCLSAHILSDDEIKNIILTFLNTNFIKLERRMRRIRRLDEEEYNA